MTAQKNIGLFGFGCVGQGLYDVLEANPSLPLSLQKVCVKTAGKQRSIPKELISYDKNDILKNEEIDLVVELIDDAEEAYHIVKEALLSGKDVISANKKMVATHLEELIALQKETGSKLLYEASVCGSIPIIRNLEEYYGHESLETVEGICNGSSNYILSKLYDEGAAYEDAPESSSGSWFCREQSEIGCRRFRFEVQTMYSGSSCFRKYIESGGCLESGDSAYQKSRYRKSQSQRTKNKTGSQGIPYRKRWSATKCIASVCKSRNNLFAIDNEWNAVSLKAQFSQRQLFVGKGAGDHPTAASVLSDITGWLRGYAYSYTKLENHSTSTQADELLTVYVSAADEAALNQLPYEEIISAVRLKKARV